MKQRGLNPSQLKVLLELRGLDILRPSGIIVPQEARSILLMEAVIKGNLPEIRMQIKHGGNPNAYNRITGITCLMISASQGSVKVMKILLESGVDINKSDRRGNTALHHAMEGANLHCVHLLMAKNCSTNIRNSDGRTPLMLAAANGHMDIFQYMLNNGVPLRTKMSLNSENEFTLACAEGHFELASMILDRIKSVADKRSNLQTTLLQCINRNQEAIIDFLINQGADINFQSGKLKPPLMEAIDTGDCSIVYYLLQKGVNVNIEDESGRLPIDVARRSKNSFIFRLIKAAVHGDATENEETNHNLRDIR